MEEAMKIFSSLFLLIITACSTTKPLEHQAQVSIDENLLLQIQKENSWGRAPASVNLVEEKISPHTGTLVKIKKTQVIPMILMYSIIRLPEFIS